MCSAASAKVESPEKWADFEEDKDEYKKSAGKWADRRRVRFDGVIRYHYVPAYSTLFGRHPNTFHFSPDGLMIDARSDDSAQALLYRHRPEDCVEARGELGQRQGGAHEHTSSRPERADMERDAEVSR